MRVLTYPFVRTSGRFNSSRVSTTWATEICLLWKRVLVEGTFCMHIIILIAYDGNLKGVSMTRYSLLMHHGEEELRRFGFTDEMLIDQEW